MWPATAFDDDEWEQRARGWAVTRIVRNRRDRHVAEARDARRRLRERASRMEMMTASSMARDAADDALTRWVGGPNVLAFLFAQPDSDAIAALAARGEYLDCRSGDTWDLFFPGYYRSTQGLDFERRVGARPVGAGFVDDWFFHPGDFDAFRRDIERLTQRRWEYSGGTDLVVASGWMSRDGAPSVDWHTTMAGSLTDSQTGHVTLTLPEVVERLSRQLERALASPDYGMPEVSGAASVRGDVAGGTRDLVTNALGGIIAALAGKAFGA